MLRALSSEAKKGPRFVTARRSQKGERKLEAPGSNKSSARLGTLQVGQVFAQGGVGPCPQFRFSRGRNACTPDAARSSATKAPPALATTGERGASRVGCSGARAGDEVRPGSIATGAPEIIYFPIFDPEGPLVASQAREVPGLEETVLMGADGLFADTMPEATGSAAVGMYLSGPYVDVNN